MSLDESSNRDNLSSPAHAEVVDDSELIVDEATAAATAGLDVPSYRKLQILNGLSRDQLMQTLVKPLLLRMGFRLLEEQECGIAVQGISKFNQPEVFAVIAVARNLSMAKSGEAIECVVKRLADSLAHFSKLASDAKTSLQYIVYVAGSANDRATDAIRDLSVNGTVIRGLELLPLIDQHFADFWKREFATAHRYFLNLRRELIGEHVDGGEVSNGSSVRQFLATPEGFMNAATDDRYTELIAFKSSVVPKKGANGKVSLQQKSEELPASDLFKAKERLIILYADAGSGKSTVMRRMALRLAEDGILEPDRAITPILLRAIDIAAECDNLGACLALKLQQVMATRFDAIPETSSLLKGRHIVVIDALDELKDDAERHRVLQLGASYMESTALANVIVTSREYGTIRDARVARQYAAYRIKPIDLKQAGTIVKRLRGDKSRIPTEATTDVLRRLQDVHSIALNPLLVAVFVATTEDVRQDVPANITELFKKFTELMLGRWDEVKGFNQQYQAPLKDYVLQHVAYQMHSRGARAMPIDDFQSTIAEFLIQRGLRPNIAQLLDEVTYRSGLVRVVGEDVEFRHHLFQEFFAGRAIENPSEVVKLIGDDWWRNAIVFYFGDKPGHGEILLEALNRDSYDDLQRHEVAVTAGQALQASYLTSLAGKRAVFEAVINVLSQTYKAALSAHEAGESRPFIAAVIECLAVVESLGLGALGEFSTDLFNKLGATQPSGHVLQQFYIVLGLLESRNYGQAVELLGRFNSNDLALWFGLDVIGFLRESISSYSSDKERDDLAEIRQMTKAAVAPAIPSIISEMNRALTDNRSKQEALSEMES